MKHPQEKDYVILPEATAGADGAIGASFVSTTLMRPGSGRNFSGMESQVLESSSGTTLHRVG